MIDARIKDYGIISQITCWRKASGFVRFEDNYGGA